MSRARARGDSSIGRSGSNVPPDEALNCSWSKPSTRKSSKGSAAREQRVLGGLHGCGLVMFVLAQKQEVLANLVLAEGGRIALEMLGQFADVAEVLFSGGRP